MPEDIIEKLKQIEDIHSKLDYAERTVRRLKKKVSELRTDSERARIIGLEKISKELLELSRYIEIMILPKVERAFKELSEQKENLTNEIKSQIDRCAEIHLDPYTWLNWGHLFRLDTDGSIIWYFLLCKLVNGEFIIVDTKYKDIVWLHDRIVCCEDKWKLFEEYIKRYGITLATLKS